MQERLREEICYACPAAPCSSTIGCAVYMSIEALKQHRARRHNKQHDSESYLSLEALNNLILRGDVKRVPGIQLVAGGIWVSPSPPISICEAHPQPAPPEFRVQSLFEERTGILTKYPPGFIEVQRKNFQVKISGQERLYMQQALSFLDAVEAKSYKVDFYLRRIMKRNPDGTIPTKGFQALNTKSSKR